MPVRRARRTATLDEFFAASRELARRAREEQVDTEALIARVAEEAARRALESRREARLAPEDVTLVAKTVSEAVAETVSKMLDERLGELARMVKELAEEVRRLRGDLARLPTRPQSGERQEERLPPWARRLAKLLAERPYVRLHEEGVDVMRLKTSPGILERLDAVIVETSTGLYLLPRRKWEELVEKLSSAKSRDEEEALRRAGPYAEVVAALLRDNLLYYNNGWRVLRDAVYDPRG